MIKNFGVLRITAASLLLALGAWHSRAWGQNNAQVSQDLPGPVFLRDNSDRFDRVPVYLPPDELTPYNFSPPPNIGGISSKLYLVYIPRDDRRIMERVRLVEPEAFFSIYRGRRVIQAGVFGIRSNAQRRARELERDGVRAAIATLEETRPIDSFEDGFDGEPIPFDENIFDDNISSGPFPLPPLTNGPLDTGSGYIVVIPGSRPDLAIIANLAVEAGISENEIAFREEPIGTHVAIGPFPTRTNAQQESDLLRGFGLDARVYYRR